MSEDKPETRTAAASPSATKHLKADQNKALDLQADAEHTDGEERETLTRKITKLGSSTAKPTSD